MASDLMRTGLGRHFNEGARLLWLALRKSGKSRAAMGREAGLSSSAMHRFLYGDQRPDRSSAIKLKSAFGIDPAAWDVAAASTGMPPLRHRSSRVAKNRRAA